MPPSPARCNYSKGWDNGGGGFGGNLTIINLGDPLTSWTLTFAFPNQQQVTQGWSANWSQSGQNVTATNAPWNGNLPTNAQLGIGFNGSYTGGVNNNPQTFAINGVTCTGPQQPQTLVVAPTAVTVPEGGTRHLRRAARHPAHRQRRRQHDGRHRRHQPHRRRWSDADLHDRPTGTSTRT